MKRKERRFTTMVTMGISLFLIFAPFSPTAAQTWIQQFPTNTLPDPRAQAGNAYDENNDRLILFSGFTSSGYPFPNDVWVLSNSSGSGGTPSWIQLLSPVETPPQGRSQHTVLYDPTSNRIIVHGGCGGFCSPALADVWVLTNANGLGGAPNWIQLPSAQIGRAGHVAAYDPGSNRMIVFGGHEAFPNTDRNDVWILTDANGIGSPTWMQLLPTGSPPPGRGEPATGVYDPSSNNLIIFGGRTTTNTNFNDVWILSNANGLGGTPQWTQLFPTGTPPTPRGGHSMVYDPNSNRTIIFGGVNDGSPSIFNNDVWILTNGNGTGGSAQWIQLSPTGGPPPPRFSHSGVYSKSSNRMVITNGTDGQIGPNFFNDIWVLTDANGITTVTIDIEPWFKPNIINPKFKWAPIPVAILSESGFDAPKIIDQDSLTFGHGGDENSLAFCIPLSVDVNRDKTRDLICFFYTGRAGFQCGDTRGTLRGRTKGGMLIEGSDSVKIVPCR